MAFVDIAAGTAIVGTGISAYKSIKQGAQANALDKANPRPTYQIPPEYQQNLNIANQMAMQGIPQQAYNNQVNGINQNQAGAIAALSRSANPGANLASVVRAGDNADNQLNAQDANVRAQNLRLAMQTRGQLAQQKLAAQQYNQFDKYSENFNRAQALRGASNANLGNAINGASGLATGLANAYSDNDNETMGQKNGATPLSFASPKYNIPQTQSLGFGQQPVTTQNILPQTQFPQYNYGVQWN